jgi:hypothetical protein
MRKGGTVVPSLVALRAGLVAQIPVLPEPINFELYKCCREHFCLDSGTGMDEKARLRNTGETSMEIMALLLAAVIIIGGGVKVTIGDINIGNGRKEDQDK